MTVYPLTATFARGELSPRLHGRPDIQHYAMSLADAKNWLVMRQGGLRRRPGFRYIHPVRTESEKGRLIKFEFNAEQGYAVLLNASFIRFYTLGGLVTQTAQNITAITKANPGVVTYSGADTYANGDRVLLRSIGGMTELNNREATVANVNTGANTFELSGIDTSAYTTYTTGGTIAEIYEIASPYAEADLWNIQYTQSGDTVYFSCDGYAPRKLVRTSETSWALSEIAFEDGPWLDEDTQGTYLTIAGNGAITPTMTDNTTPSGTASDDDSSALAWRVFTGGQNGGFNLPGTSGWVQYDIAGAATKVCDGYWLGVGNNFPDRMPTAWTLQGWDGGAWIVLDTRDGESGWTTGERRYYEFPGKTAYLIYRFQWTAVNGSPNYSNIGALVMHEAGDNQTAFNVTASATTGINGGTGFQTTDVGRTIRILGPDGKYRWLRIVARTSTTVVTARLYGHALVKDGLRISRWQLSAWSASNGYPSTVAFYEDRLTWGASDGEPRKLWPSQTADYEDHGLSSPPQANDGINAALNGGRLDRITFLAEMDDLVVGTASGIRVVGPSDPSSAFSSTNLRQRQRSTDGAAAVQPAVIGGSLVYVDRYRRHVHEFTYSNEGGGWGGKELSILSDHLFASGAVEIALQQTGEDDIVWFTMTDGTLVALTYELAQQIAGFTPVEVAGGGSATAVVESAVAIPSVGGDVLYAVVKRTINGATRRYVEYLAPAYATGGDVSDAVYFDSAGVYDSSSTSTLTGLHWLIGESVGILANGVDVGDATVSAAGNLTLPSAGATVIFGKRYQSRGQTLRAPQAGNRDGSALGRKMIVHGVAVDMMDAAGIEAGSLESTRVVPLAARQGVAGTLYTGMYEVPISDRHDNEGVVVFTTNKGYPATVRALQLAISGEP